MFGPLRPRNPNFTTWPVPSPKWPCINNFDLKFPGAVILNTVGRKRAQSQVRKKAQKGAKERKRVSPCKIANNHVGNNQVWELLCFF